MIRIKLEDGTEQSYQAAAAVITLDQAGVPQRLKLADGSENAEWEATEVRDLVADPDNTTFRVQVERPSGQVIGPTIKNVNSAHLDFDHQQIFAFVGSQRTGVYAWSRL